MEVLYWLIAVAVFIIIEILTLGLTTIWFAGGALVAAIASALGANLAVQVILFLVVAIGLLIITRPIAKKYFNGHTQKTNAESLIGKDCIVSQKINNIQAQGQVIVNGQEWTARATIDNLIIEQGTKVVIESIQGVKLIVKR